MVYEEDAYNKEGEAARHHGTDELQVQRRGARSKLRPERQPVRYMRYAPDTSETKDGIPTVRNGIWPWRIHLHLFERGGTVLDGAER